MNYSAERKLTRSIFTPAVVILTRRILSKPSWSRAAGMGIKLFKTRGRNWEPKRTAWVIQRAAKLGMAVGVDMVQNLANPGQTVNDVVQFLARVAELTDQPIRFLEEPLGPMETENFRLLREGHPPDLRRRDHHNALRTRPSNRRKCL